MRRPPLLKKGDKVIIVSPSRQINESQLPKAIAEFEKWGLNVIVGEHALSTHGYFAGSDDERLADFQNAVNDPEIAGIFCSRGGYGFSKIIDNLDLSPLSDHPKWIVGFSDITVLHLKLNQMALQSIHGLMPVQFEYEGVNQSIESLRNVLFNDKFNYQWKSNRENLEGEVEAEIVGGNLSLLIDSLGTKTELDTTGKILFIEEIDEYYYKIDRMFNHLKRAGKFDQLKGLIIGQFTDLKDTQIPFGHSLYNLVKSKLPNSSIPVAFHSPFGHEAYNLALPIGRKVKFCVKKEESSIVG